MTTTTSLAMFGSESTSQNGGKTFIIFGVNRGGTSMVAGAVRGFGIHLGSNLPVNNEDPDFAYRTAGQMAASIAERNSALQDWGWKFPMAESYLDKVLPRVRNPHLIIVSRDMVATASARVRYDRGDVSGGLWESALQSQKNFVLALRWRIPTLFVSYERAAIDPSGFLTELSQYIGKDLVVNRDRLIEYMAKGSYKAYEEIVLL